MYKKQKGQDWDHKAYHNVQLPNEEGDMHIIWHLVHYDMPCDPNIVSSAFYTIPICSLNCKFTVLLSLKITFQVQGTNGTSGNQGMGTQGTNGTHRSKEMTHFSLRPLLGDITGVKGQRVGELVQNGKLGHSCTRVIELWVPC